MHGDFPNKLMRIIHAGQCLALYSRLGLSAVQTSEPCTSKTCGNTLLALLLCNVSYRVSYRDNCIGIRIVSWKNVSLQAYLKAQEVFTRNMTKLFEPQIKFSEFSLTFNFSAAV